MKNLNQSFRRTLILLFLFTPSLSVLACDACKKQQPKFLQGITHGTGPDSGWDYLIVAIMVVITLYVFAATLKCLIKPAESEERHIKRMILND
ncbi:hypothetical protein [Mucilaginibacter sp.]|uniref:hypothetical protein n=1 Tax=Mucilaginibacter sp. TaxID=1882438 RepID=UPI0035BC5CFE